MGTTKVIALITGALSTLNLSSKHSSLHSIQTATEMLSTESLTSTQPMTSKGSTGVISALTSESESTLSTLSSKYISLHSIQTDTEILSTESFSSFLPTTSKELVTISTNIKKTAKG